MIDPYCSYEYQLQKHDEFIEESISHHQVNAIAKVKNAVNPNLIKPFGSLLAFAALEWEDAEALKIVDYLGLNDEELASLMDNSIWMERVLERDKIGLY